MSFAYHSAPRDRAGAAALSLACAGALGWALLFGLSVPRVPAASEALKLFAATPVPRPPEVRPTPAHRRVPRREGKASPRNIRSQATQVTAPPPLIPLPVPQLVTVAPVVGLGAAPTQGAAPVRGPGYGAGGIGDGRGAGDGGDGDGGGWGEETMPVPLRGRLKNSDYPREAADAGASGLVALRCDLEVTGRVTGCRVTRSSGSAVLDRETARLSERKLRYRPWLDRAGRPVRSVLTLSHEWVLEREPAD